MEAALISAKEEILMLSSNIKYQIHIIFVENQLRGSHSRLRRRSKGLLFK